jgi:hypothetical protein
MLVYFSRELHMEARQFPRTHPWTVSEGRPGGRYIDFKVEPHLIREGLEDLDYLAGTVAETAIVNFLAWANSPASAVETNDFGLRPLKTNESGINDLPLEQTCRLTILFRDLRRNTTEGNLIPFAQAVEAALSAIDPEFREACWGWCLWPHLFTALGRDNPASTGSVVQYILWTWGRSESDVHTNMVRALTNLREAVSSSVH